MSTLIFILAILGLSYCLLTYGIAAAVLHADLEAKASREEIREDVICLVLAPIAVPYQILRNN